MDFSDYTNIENDFFKAKNPLKKLLSLSMHLLGARQTGILYGTNDTGKKLLPTDTWDRGVIEKFDGQGLRGFVLRRFGARIVTARKLSPIYFYTKGPKGESIDNNGIIAFVLRTCAGYYKNGVSVVFCPESGKIPQDSSQEYMSIPFYVYDGKKISKPDEMIKANVRIVKQFNASNFISIYLPNYGILVINSADESLFQKSGNAFGRETELRNRFDLLIKLVEISSLALLGRLKGTRGGEMLWRKEQHLRETSLRLTANEKQYRDLYENAPIAYFSMTPEGMIYRLNRQTGKLFGYANGDLAGKDISTLLTGEQTPEYTIASILDKVSGGSCVKDLEIKMHRLSGDPIWVSLSIDPVFGADDKVIELRATAMDITQRLETEQAQAARREAEIAASSRREFLDNSGEGFLSFGRDLTIEKEYSRECRNIFNMELAGQPIARVLHSQDPCGEKAAIKNFNRILSEDDPYTRQLYLSLMPDEYPLGEKYVRAVYKCIAPGRMMLILTDITQQKQMETELQNEHNRLKFVVSAVIEVRDFFELLEEFHAFQNQSLPLMVTPSEGPGDFLEEIYRHVHTFKGLFSQQNFIHMPKALHQAENYLSDLIHTHDFTRQNLEDLLEKFDCTQALEKDLEIIRNILGQSFMEQKGQVSINRDKARMMAQKAGQLLKLPYGPDIVDAVKDLLTSVITLEYIDLKALISPHANGAEALAGRLGKQLKPIEIQGDDIKVPPDLVSPFTKTLVHVFRNAVDHGIESIEEREDSQKDESATITCFVQKEKGRIHICIGDDGRGIDFLALKKEAANQGLLSDKQASDLDCSGTLDLLFRDRFSTKPETTEFSGRGMGLSAVRNALARLNGEVKIETIPAKGTTFHFWIPLAIVRKEMNSPPLP